MQERLQRSSESGHRSGGASAAGPLRRKLSVGATDDPAEREADAFADRVMAEIDGMPEAIAFPTSVSATRIRRRAPLVGAAGGELDPTLTRAVADEASTGRPLEPAVRHRIQRAVGADLSDVRVHPESAVAPQIGASAFTQGRHIHFAAGRYQPGSPAGLELLAHEVGHVVQNGQAPIVRRMWDLDRYDQEIPKHKGWLHQSQIRDYLEQYFKVVKKYPKSFKTRAAADQAFADAMAEANQLVTHMTQSLDAYRSGMQHEAGKLAAASPEAADLKQRIAGVAKFIRSLAVETVDELRAKHHDAVMPLLVESSGQRVVGERERQGKAISGAAQGGVNTLGKASYAVGGRTVSGYTKVDRPNVSDPGRASGISVDQAKMSLRAVATYRVSELLNLGLVPETVLLRDAEGKTGQLMAEAHGSPGQGLMPGDEFGPENDKMRNAVQKLLDKLNKPGLNPTEKKAIIKEMGAVAKANHGVTVIGNKIYELGSVVADFNWWDPALQRHLNALQFFDLLVGHADRHSGNYIIDFDPADANRRVRGIKGIDNDDAWGEQMTAARFGNVQFSKTPLPAMVDVKTAVKFLLGDWNQVHAILQQMTMTPAEIAAAQARFTAVQAHIRTLATTGHLVNDTGALDAADVVALASVNINLPAATATMQWGAGTQAASTWQNSYTGIQSDEKTAATTHGTTLYTPVYA